MKLGGSRTTWTRALALTFAVLAALQPGVAQAYGTGRLYFQFRDDRILESSGVVASSVRDGVFFTHNDSPGTAEDQALEARVFAVDDHGCTLAELRLSGALNQDWEDIARGPSDIGSSLWLGDIGDNNHNRAAGIDVYRISEPAMNESAVRSSRGCPTPAVEDVRWTRYRLTYPVSPQDAETLLAHPVTGQLFVVTKSPPGAAAMVYAAPQPLLEGLDNPLTLVALATVPPSATLARGPALDQQFVFDVAGRSQTTGGDISPDGTKVVVRTYTDAWEWDVTDGDIPRAFASVPRQVPLRYAAQGEAIGYTRDGRALVTTCERADRICEGAHIYE